MTVKMNKISDGGNPEFELTINSLFKPEEKGH